MSTRLMKLSQNIHCVTAGTISFSVDDNCTQNIKKAAQHMKFRQRNVTDKLTYSNLFNQSTKMCLNEKFCMQIKTKPTPDAKINRFLA